MSDRPTIAAAALSHSPPMARDQEHRLGLTFRHGFARLKAAVAAFEPTLVVYFGPDHLRALTDIAPCFTVVESATGYGDWGTPAEDYDVPGGLAVDLGQHLVAAGIDIALAARLRLDHGFGQSTHDLFDSLSAVPLIPIVINCVDRPLATLRRTAALGDAVGDFLRTRLDPGERVLVIGSGGLSHSPPSLVPGARDLDESQRQALIDENLARAAEAIAPAFDLDFLQRLSGDGWSDLGRQEPDYLRPAGTGGAEIRTWLATAFALGAPLETVAYQPVAEWITGMGIAASANLVSLLARSASEPLGTVTQH